MSFGLNWLKTFTECAFASPNESNPAWPSEISMTTTAFKSGLGCLSPTPTVTGKREDSCESWYFPYSKELSPPKTIRPFPSLRNVLSLLTSPAENDDAGISSITAV